MLRMNPFSGTIMFCRQNNKLCEYMFCEEAQEKIARQSTVKLKGITATIALNHIILHLVVYFHNTEKFNSIK